MNENLFQTININKNNSPRIFSLIDATTTFFDFIWETLSSPPYTPVILQVPIDCLDEEVNKGTQLHQVFNSCDFQLNLENGIELTRNAIIKSESPLFIIGQGLNDTMHLLNKLPFPFVTTIMSKIIENDYPNNMGVIGILGDSFANELLKSSDLLVCIGCRLSERSILNNPDVVKNKRIIYVNIASKYCMYRNSFICHVECDAQLFLKAIIDCVNKNPKDYNFPVMNLKETIGPINTDAAINYDESVFNVTSATTSILKMADSNTLICLDDGLYTLSTLKLYRHSRILFWGSVAAGGSSVGSAIGAAFTNLYNKVLVIIGDGGILSVVGELQTIVKYKLPILIILYNNKGYRSISNWFGEEYSEQFGHVNFELISKSFGLNYVKCFNCNDIKKFQTEKAQEDLPCMIELEIANTIDDIPNHFTT